MLAAGIAGSEFRAGVALTRFSSGVPGAALFSTSSWLSSDGAGMAFEAGIGFVLEGCVVTALEGLGVVAG